MSRTSNTKYYILERKVSENPEVQLVYKNVGPKKIQNFLKISKNEAPEMSRKQKK